MQGTSAMHRSFLPTLEHARLERRAGHPRLRRYPADAEKSAMSGIESADFDAVQMLIRVY